MQPIEQMRKDTNTIQQRAISNIQYQLSDGDITEAEAQQALNSRSGSIWDAAITQATMETEADRPDPFQYASLLTGFSLPVQWAYNAATGQKQKIGQLPITRTVKAATSMLGINKGRGINIEDPIRRALSLPLQMDRWDTYRIERELASMAAEGVISTDDALRAMMDKGGPAYTQAQTRIQQGTMNWKALFGFVSADTFPEGEQEQRALKDEYLKALDAYKAGDKNAINDFYDRSPEYRARQAMGQEPESRLRRYLISMVWEKYMAMPDLYRKQVTEQLGTLFQDAFLDKETRSYDTIPTPNLTQWAQVMGGETPKAAGEVPKMDITLASPEIAQIYQRYKDEQEALFPNINAIYDQINALPDGEQKDALYNLPEMVSYEAWKNEYLANYPQIIPYAIGKDNRLAGASADVQALVYQFRALKLRQFPQLDNIMDEYYAIPEEQPDARKTWRNQNAQAYQVIKDYYSFREQFMKAYPQTIPYILTVESLASQLFNQYTSSSGSSGGSSGGSSRSYSTSTRTSTPQQPKHLTVAQVAHFSNPLVRQLYSYYYGLTQLEGGAIAELTRLWEAFGSPGESLQDWIDTIVKPSFVT